MRDHRPNALRPLGAAGLAALLFFLLKGHDADAPRVRAPMPARLRPKPLSASHRALQEILRAKREPRGVSVDARDAVAGLPDWEAHARARLEPMVPDWRDFWNDAFLDVTASRRDPRGRVTHAQASTPAWGTSVATQRAEVRRTPVTPDAGIRTSKAFTPASSTAASAAPRTAAGSRERDVERGARAGRSSSLLRSRAAALDRAALQEERFGISRASRGQLEGPLPGRLASLISDYHARRALREANRKRVSKRTLQSLLGKGVLRPPSGLLVPPDFWRVGPIPPGPDGKPLRVQPATPADLDQLTPPDAEAGYRRWSGDAGKGGHWHSGAKAAYHHDEHAWGTLLRAGRWAWLLRSEGNWWSWSGQTPLVWHAKRWWWFKDDTWFLAHEGQAWAYRYFAELKREGLFEPESRVRVVYSEDEKRAAVAIPGQETVVYDLDTGRELGRLPTEEPEHRARPRNKRSAARE